MHELNAMPVQLSSHTSKFPSNHVQATLTDTVSITGRPLSLPKTHSGPHGRCTVSVVSSRSSGDSVCQSICSAATAPATTTPSREILHQISCYPLRKKISKLNKETLYCTVRQKCSGDILVQLPFSYSSPQCGTQNKSQLNDRYITTNDEHDQRLQSPFSPSREKGTVSSSSTVRTDCSTKANLSTRSPNVSFDQSCHDITVEFSSDSPRKKISKIDLDVLFSSSAKNFSKDIVAQYPYDSPRRTIPPVSIFCDKAPSSTANNGLLVTDNGLVNITRDLLVATEMSKKERGVRWSSQSNPDPIRKRNREYALRTLQAYEKRAHSSEERSLASRAIKELHKEKQENHQTLSTEEHRHALHKLLRDLKQADINLTHENETSCSAMQSYPEFTVMDDRPLEALTQLCSFEQPERLIYL
jgi:hypothetical protein